MRGREVEWGGSVFRLQSTSMPRRGETLRPVRDAIPLGATTLGSRCVARMGDGLAITETHGRGECSLRVRREIYPMTSQQRGDRSWHATIYAPYW